MYICICKSVYLFKLLFNLHGEHALPNTIYIHLNIHIYISVRRYFVGTRVSTLFLYFTIDLLQLLCKHTCTYTHTYLQTTHTYRKLHSNKPPLELLARL